MACVAADDQQLHDYYSAGGSVLFGTDVGYTTAYDTTEEYQLLHEAGLDYRAILASLTTNPSQRFGDASHKGRIAPGMDADLVVLQGDPASDFTAFAHVQDTIKGGELIYSRDSPTAALCAHDCNARPATANSGPVPIRK
jgi:imidazolonepropionase-like amidohydrolase